VRALGIEPVHDTRATFCALVDAMSRPGTVQRVATDPADHCVVATLVDHEVTVHTPSADLRGALESEGRYEPAAPDTADVVHAHGAPSWDVRDVNRGTLVEPSDGATVVYRVESLAMDRDRDATSVRVEGPGVPDDRVVSLGLPAVELAALADAQSSYPRGVDAVFTAGDRVVGFPRSVSLEVL
jgi:alpha-D-ribose 1-methylphosphonate 5-triphosphate synthase subunit PhnH